MSVLRIAPLCVRHWCVYTTRTRTHAIRTHACTPQCSTYGIVIESRARIDNNPLACVRARVLIWNSVFRLSWLAAFSTVRAGYVKPYAAKRKNGMRFRRGDDLFVVFCCARPAHPKTNTTHMRRRRCHTIATPSAPHFVFQHMMDNINKQ